jgi:hypothetical protein
MLEAQALKARSAHQTLHFFHRIALTVQHNHYSSPQPPVQDNCKRIEDPPALTACASPQPCMPLSILGQRQSGPDTARRNSVALVYPLLNYLALFLSY